MSKNYTSNRTTEYAVMHKGKILSSFGDWEFLLDGDVNELRKLASEKGTFYFNIYGGVDDWLDCPNDDFRMTTLYCEGEDDPRVIWKIGHELVSLFNGASVL